MPLSTRTGPRRALVVLAATLLLAACSGSPSVREATRGGIPLPPSLEVRKHERDVVDLAISPDGRTLATVSGDAIVLWDTASMTPSAVIDTIDGLEFHEGLAVDDDGRRVAVITAHFELVLWEEATLETRPVTYRYGLGPRELVGFGPEGSLFWLSVEDELVQWRPPTAPDSPDTLQPVGDVSYFAQSSPAGSAGFLLWTRVPTLVAVDADHRAHLEPLAGDGVPDGRRADPVPLLGGTTRRRLVIDRPEDGLALLDLDTGTPLPLSTNQPRARQGERDVLAARALSPDGALLALAWRSGGIELWDTDTGELVATLNIDERYVRSVHPSPVLDLAFGHRELWLLLPEQKLLRIRIGRDDRIEVEDTLEL